MTLFEKYFGDLPYAATGVPGESQGDPDDERGDTGA